MIDEVMRLRELAGVVYAGLGAECGLPEAWLDTLLAASQGEIFTTKGLLPYTAEPLIYTKNGNVPESGLQMTVEWFITSEYIKVVKKHFDKETGEMVKEGADVLSLHGVTGESILGKLNG